MSWRPPSPIHDGGSALTRVARENAKSAATDLGGVSFSPTRRKRLLEVLALALVTTGLVLFSRRSVQPALIEDTEDLPCPWCHAPTQAEDIRCPSCGRRFG